MGVNDVKAALLDSFYGTERGLSASVETRAEVDELVVRLEAFNKNTSPLEGDESRAALSGTWRLVYTAQSELVLLLALGRLPGVKVGEVTQEISADCSEAINRVALELPASRTSISSTARLEVRSPRRLSVKFTESAIQTPELTADLEFPSQMDVLGRQVDLSPAAPLLDPLAALTRQGLEFARQAVAQLPKEFNAPVPDQSSLPEAVRGVVGAANGAFGVDNSGASWLLTTYLDADTRVARGPGGSVFVMTKTKPFDAADAAPASATETPITVAFDDDDEAGDEAPVSVEVVDDATLEDAVEETSSEE